MSMVPDALALTVSAVGFFMGLRYSQTSWCSRSMKYEKAVFRRDDFGRTMRRELFATLLYQTMALIGFNNIKTLMVERSYEPGKKGRIWEVCINNGRIVWSKLIEDNGTTSTVENLDQSKIFGSDGDLAYDIYVCGEMYDKPVKGKDEHSNSQSNVIEIGAAPIRAHCTSLEAKPSPADSTTEQDYDLTSDEEEAPRNYAQTTESQPEPNESDNIKRMSKNARRKGHRYGYWREHRIPTNQSAEAESSRTAEIETLPTSETTVRETTKYESIFDSSSRLKVDDYLNRQFKVFVKIFDELKAGLKTNSWTDSDYDVHDVQMVDNSIKPIEEFITEAKKEGRGNNFYDDAMDVMIKAHVGVINLTTTNPNGLFLRMVFEDLKLIMMNYADIAERVSNSKLKHSIIALRATEAAKYIKHHVIPKIQKKEDDNQSRIVPFERAARTHLELLIDELDTDKGSMDVLERMHNAQHLLREALTMISYTDGKSKKRAHAAYQTYTLGTLEVEERMNAAVKVTAASKEIAISVIETSD